MRPANKIVCILALLGASGCVSQEQIQKNKERIANAKEETTIVVSGCNLPDGSDACVVKAKKACDSMNLDFVNFYSTRAQTAAGNGEIFVKCVARV